MTDQLLAFPSPSPPESVTGRKLVGVWISAEFAAAIDRWRLGQDDTPSRTEAMRRLAALGLAGEMLGNAKATRRKR